MQQIPKIGIGIMVIKDSMVLVGKRRGSHGEGEYSFVGGHFEYMETFEGCARREVKEETGLEIENIRFQCVANIRDYDPKHYVLVGLVADWKSGEPTVMEPDKNEEWRWRSLDELPDPMFVPSRYLAQSYTTGKTYFDE